MGTFSSTMRWAPFASPNFNHKNHKKSLTNGGGGGRRAGGGGGGGGRSLNNNSRKSRRSHSSDNWRNHHHTKNDNRRKRRAAAAAAAASSRSSTQSFLEVDAILDDDDDEEMMMEDRRLNYTDNHTSTNRGGVKKGTMTSGSSSSSTSSLIMGSSAPLLYEQALVGNWKDLMKRIKTHPMEAQYVDKCRNAAIHLACRRQPPADVIAALLRASSPTNKMVTMDGLTPLHFAAYCGANTKVIQILLQEEEQQQQLIQHHHHQQPYHPQYQSYPSSISPPSCITTTASSSQSQPPPSLQPPSTSSSSSLDLHSSHSTTININNNNTNNRGGSFFLVDRRGRTPLHCVCAGFRTVHRPEVVRLLLQSHPWSALQADEHHRTPFTLMMDDYAEEIDDALLLLSSSSSSSSSITQQQQTLQQQLWQTRILPSNGELHECWNILLLLLHAAHLGTVPSSSTLIPPHRYPSYNTITTHLQNSMTPTSSNSAIHHHHHNEKHTNNNNNINVGQYYYNSINTKSNNNNNNNNNTSMDSKQQHATAAIVTSMETKVDSSSSPLPVTQRIFSTQVSSNSLLLQHHHNSGGISNNSSTHLSSSLNIMDNYEVDLNNAPFRPVHAVAACAGSDPYFPSGLVKLILALYAPLGGAREEDEELNLPLHIAVRSQMYHSSPYQNHTSSSFNSCSTLLHSNKWNQFSLNNSSTHINNLYTTHNNHTTTDIYNANNRQNNNNNNYHQQQHTIHNDTNRQQQQYPSIYDCNNTITNNNSNHNRQSTYDPTSTTIIVTTKKEQDSKQQQQSNNNNNNRHTFIQDLIELCPNAASIRDETGKYPLFLAIETGKPWEYAVEPIFKAFPDAFAFHASSLQATFMNTLSHPNQMIRDETARTLGHIFRNWPTPQNSNKNNNNNHKNNNNNNENNNNDNPISIMEDMKLADHDSMSNNDDYYRNYNSIRTIALHDKQEEEDDDDDDDDDDFGYTIPYNHFGHELERPNADNFIIALIEMSMHGGAARTKNSKNYSPSSNRNADVQVQVSMLQALYSALSNVPKEAIQIPDTPDKALMSCIELLQHHPDETVRDSAARVIGSAVTLLSPNKAMELLHTLVPIDNKNNSDEDSSSLPKKSVYKPHSNSIKSSESVSSLEIDIEDEEECKDINIILHGRAAACYRILSSMVCETVVYLEEEKTYFHELAFMVKDWMVDADEVMVRKAACLAIGPMLGYGFIQLKEVKHTIMKCMRAIEDAEVHIFLARGLMVAARKKNKVFICKNGIPILDCALMLAMSAPVAVQKMFHGFLWIALGFEHDKNAPITKPDELENSVNKGFVSEYMALAQGENGRIMMSLVTKTLSNIVSVKDIW